MSLPFRQTTAQPKHHACVPATPVKCGGTRPARNTDMIDGRGDRDPRNEEPFEQPVQDDAAESVEQAEPYFPATDPVMGEGPLGEIGGSGDEALAELVRRALAEDAETTDLEVEVDVRDRIATLRGRVPELTDTDNALA